MSEIQPSLGELEDAQNTAYENFFTARDAVTAAGERVAAADEAVCLAEKKYMNSEISVEEWEATLQELSDAQVAETAANENYEAAAAGAQAAAEAVEAKKQELRDSRVNDTAYVVHCARIECPFGMRESYLALDATHGVLTHQIPQMTVKDMILVVLIGDFRFGVPVSVPELVVGMIGAVIASLIYQLFVFSVDYSRTEYTQFEDDDYYYYVKAVPKIAISRTDVKVQEINKVKRR